MFAAEYNVTERKRLNLVLLEKNVELEGAISVTEISNLAQSDFLFSMTHDLRSPLSAIFGFTLLTGDGSIAHIFYR